MGSSTFSTTPEWVKSYKPKLDYGWRLNGNEVKVLNDNTITINGYEAETVELLIDESLKTKSILSCVHCGICTSICPSIPANQNENILMTYKLLHQGKLGLIDFKDKSIWTCATCGLCIDKCPRGVDIVDFMESLRKIIVKLGVGYSPKSLQKAMVNLASVGNPFGEAPGKRGLWAKEFDVKPFTKDMELLLFLGCFAGYDPRVRKTAIALINILKKSGVSFGILGSEENCCGDNANKVGNTDLFLKLASKNIKTFTDRGVTTILTISPHCFHTFKNEYPKFDKRIEVIHYTEYLSQLIDEGRLKFSKELKKVITYHDPCYLCRHNGISNEPRQVINSIPGVIMKEMPDSRNSSLCCGGGGGRMYFDSDKDQGFSYVRMKQAEDTGADILATACPFCLLNFENLPSAGDNPKMEIKDIAELVWEAI